MEVLRVWSDTTGKSKMMKTQSEQYKMDKSLSKSERRGLLLEWYHSTSEAKSVKDFSTYFYVKNDYN